MGEFGNVIKKDGKKVTVALQRSEACSKCRACSVGMDEKTMEIECLNLCNAGVGDIVEIVLETDSFFKAVAIMYGIPFAAFIVGLLGCYFALEATGMQNAELISFAVGMVAVAATYLVIRSLEDVWKKGNFVPKAVFVAGNTALS